MVAQKELPMGKTRSKLNKLADKSPQLVDEVFENVITQKELQMRTKRSKLNKLADKSPKLVSQVNPCSNQLVKRLVFKKDEIVLAKMRGYCFWPANQ